MAIEGPLRELGIHDVFQLLDLSRKTGVLRVSSEIRHNEGQVYFEGGAVVYAEIRSNPHPLGSLLVRAGKIDEADLTRARDQQLRGDHRRLGQILVAIGAITERDLARQVRQQIEEVIFELLNWHEGYFSFREEALRDVPADVLVRIPTEALLMEAARRIDEWSRIERKIPDLSVVPALALPPPDAAEGTLDLLPPEWEVLAAVDGSRDIRAIAGFLARSGFETAKTIFGLESAGVLVLHAGFPGTEAPAAPADLEDITRRVDEALASGQLEAARAAADAALAADPQRAEWYVLLARVHLAAGRSAEAEDGLRQALRIEPRLPDALRLLGATLAQRGRFGEAVSAWEQWLAGTDDHNGAPERQRVSQAIKAAKELEAALHD